ncbi:MAG: hypothetical protein Q8882_05715 [Bacillota bacterium]|nr:hypothetical protein [Bacillota bacterium]
MPNYVDSGEIPMGFGMALAQNSSAMSKFALFTEEQRKKAIDHTHNIKSHNEMVEFAQEIADGTFNFQD